MDDDRLGVRWLLVLLSAVVLSLAAGCKGGSKEESKSGGKTEVTLATVKWRIYKAREDVQLALAREGIHLFGEEPASAATASTETATR